FQFRSDPAGLRSSTRRDPQALSPAKRLGEVTQHGGRKARHSLYNTSGPFARLPRGGPPMSPITRRDFVQTAAAAAGAVSILGDLGPIAAGDASPDPNLVRLSPEIEPLVRVIEETPRSQLLEEIAGRIRGGLAYKELLAALFLAGI